MSEECLENKLKNFIKNAEVVDDEIEDRENKKEKK